MPLKPPSSTSVGDLDEVTAWSLVSREGVSHLRPRFAGNPDVWGVEAGVREVAGRIAEPREFCLKVFVYQKGLASDSYTVDPWTSAATPGLGRVSFRTDVVELGLASTESAPSPEVLTKKTRGSATHVVAAASGLFLLSAAHVLAGADLAIPSDGTNVRWHKSGQVGRGRFTDDRQVFWPFWTSSASGEEGFADIGLARLPNATELGPYALEGATPQATSSVSWEDAGQVDRVTIHGRSGVIQARFSARVRAGLLVPNRTSGRSIRYWRLLRFLQDGATTSKGDSGAPILTPDGRLVGIHVVGNDAHSPPRRYSLALSAGDVLERLRPALGNDLRLWVVPPVA